MKKKNVLIAVGIGFALFILSKAKKYKTFWDKLDFSFSRIKVRSPFPYNTLTIVVTMEAYNQTDTNVSLYSANGVLYYQDQAIANISGGSVDVKQGRNFFDVVATIDVQNLNNLANIKFDRSNWANTYNQIISLPFVSDINYNTSLGNFNSVDKWVLKEYL
jgi:hypothetical protein